MASDIAQQSLDTAVVSDLIPTQVTVGMREVDYRRRRLREKSAVDADRYLRTHRIPIVLGPSARHYLIDRHHLARALREEGVSETPVAIVADMRDLGFDRFWAALERHNWTHPFDSEGRRCSYRDMPVSVDQLVDDPFRSLAGVVKRAGGYAKDKSPFSEFRWANFLRGRIAREVVDNDFDRAAAIAMTLAQSPDASGLPGWREPACPG